MVHARVGVNDPMDVIHASPCFFVKRPRSTKLRLCFSCQELNAVTVDMHPAIPRMEDIIEKLRGKKYFSLLDLKSGYWQVPLQNVQGDIWE